MSNSLKIAIGSDHAGFEYKSLIIEHLRGKGLEIMDCGTNSLDSCDYPDYAHPVAHAVETETAVSGILICGSANGVAITANKHKNVRAALCWLPEIASLARQHNDANVLCLPARYLTKEEAITILDTFFSTSFEGGRHLNRVNKINL